MYVCIYICIWLCIYTRFFSYIGCIYNIKATNSLYKLQENEKENSNTSSTGSFSSAAILVSRQRCWREGTLEDIP